MTSLDITPLDSRLQPLLDTCPSTAQWAADKIQTHFVDDDLLESAGHHYRVTRWYFNGLTPILISDGNLSNATR
jgi:hypothetical protein